MYGTGMTAMDEYIKKNALYEKIAQLEELSRNRYLKTPSNSPCHSRYMEQLNERTFFKQVIADFPAADVVPVRHGRWIRVSKLCGEYECSVCHGADSNCSDYYGTHIVTEQDYCPFCGAKMDGGAD